MQRIDKAVRGPGLIRRAYAYSLIVNQDGLYIIKTGPASQHAGRTSAAKDAFDSAYAPKVEVGEARLMSEPLAQLATEKYNFFFPLTQITEASVNQNNFGEICLNIRAGKEKLQFACRVNNQSEIEAFARLLKN